MSLLKMSFSAAILILVIVVIRALLLHKLPKKTFLALWGVVLCRLLIPFSIPSRFSIFTIANILKNRFYKADLSLTGMSVSPNHMAITETIPTLPEAGPENISLVLVIWLSGLLACALFFLVTHLRCRREYKTALPIDNMFVKLWQQEHPTRRNVQIRQSDKIAAPLTYGIFRPVILLPKQTDWTDETRLRYILTHELVHIRRFDTFTKLLLVSALCLHWFNPFVWLMYVLANRDIELSCDESVVRTFGVNMKSSYALTLIELEEKKNHLTPLVNNFSKNAIEERIVSIMKMKKTSLVGILLALTLVVGTTTVFVTSAVRAARGSDTDIPNSGKIVQKKSMDKPTDYSIYEAYGMTYDTKTGKYYYAGEEVRFFYDAMAGAGFTNYYTGKVDIEAEHDKNGKIIGLKYSSKEDYDRRTKAKNKKSSTTSIEQTVEGGNTQDLLKEYAQYGLSYNKLNTSWEYDGQQIKTLIDKDYIYNSDVDGVNLHVIRNNDGSFKQFEILTDDKAEQMLNNHTPESDLVVTQQN
ncbi:peptidase M56 [Paenibacillus macerans]|uniref:Peptidase M56 n=1 Tax=Paenibacillus macerans TaxID=44252 RepID=A0A6N8F113_PAEMA|nr:M56 family metallopeptidase [Paenibacillus macerans]MUG26166.1 peptidase M56 [Paenibacillus macerans]